MDRKGQKLLSRERLNKELDDILSLRLTIVSAPMGYGKTTAVRDFLDKRKIEHAWVQLVAGDGTAGYFWERFTAQISNKKNELGAALRSLGFPADAPQQAKILDLFCYEEFSQPFVIVLDDFHLLKDSRVFSLITFIVRQEIENLHIIIIARNVEALNISELTRLCGTITAKRLRFQREEVARYFKMMGMWVDDTVIAEVTERTEGWIAMIYLMLLGIKGGQSARNAYSMNELVEHNLYAPLDDETKALLNKLSLLDFFSAKQAGYVLECAGMETVLSRMQKQNAFLTYDVGKDIYKIHNILLDFLRERNTLLDTEKRHLYCRIADWFMSENDYVGAFLNYRNAGKAEKVFSILNDSGRYLSAAQFNLILDVFGGQPVNIHVKYPIAFLYYAKMLLMGGSRELRAKGMEILAEIKEYYETNLETDGGIRSFVIGETHVCHIFATFNCVTDMSYHVGEALCLFAGKTHSRIVPRKSNFTFGCPHFLYSYYREQGRLEATAKNLSTGFRDFAVVADGCGAGCEYLAPAEYALEAFDLDTAEFNALKALYKAETKEQVCIELCAMFVLMRIALFRGSLDEMMGLLGRLTEKVAAENNAGINTALDLIRGYIYGVTGEESKFPEWLRAGDTSPRFYMYQGIAFNYIVYGKSLLLQGNFIKLDVLCESYIPYFDLFHNQLGHIHNHIHRSVAKYHSEGVAAGAEELCKALAIGQADGVILPFAENFRHILPILEAAQKLSGGIDAQYLNRVIDCCRQYEKNNPSGKSPAPQLSEREKEVLALTAEGLNREEIAEKLIISLSTVKRHIENIYMKLEVNNRTKAIKKASEMGLLQ